jgi:endonuclease/exonuclease/phosphatase family metal-dependent hydrolase
MSPKFAASLFFVCTTLAQAVGLRVATFNIGANLVVPPGGGPAYFDYGIGPPGQSDHDAVRDVLDRIDADVVALEEIHGADISGGDVTSLAAGLGYPHVFIAPATNTFDPSLHVVFLSHFPFLSQTSIGSPAAAKEMTRLIPAVKVDVPGTARDPVLVAAHLKSGTEASDLFQRTIELRRLTNYLTAQGFSPAENFLVMGDFNLSSNPRTFTSIPASGMPASFTLGADITFPISYFTDPTLYFNNPSVAEMLPRQLDGSTVTFPSSGSTIDVLLTSGIIGSRPHRTEIYNSALDTSNTSGLPKSGSPLPAETSATASDHLAIFGDFELDPVLPYEFTTAGQTVNETFVGFPGTYDPYPWTTTGGTWQGVETGASTAPGFRSYGAADDPSLGFLPGATDGTATASFVNHSAETLTNLHISYTAEQWRSAQTGSADTLTVELVESGVPTALPALAFQSATNLPTGPIAGGTAAAKSMLVTGLAVGPGAAFQLKFSFMTGPNTTSPPAEVFINEFNYDDDGTDSGEFVEVVAGPGFTASLANVDLLLYNGSNGTLYETHALSSFTAGAVTASGHRLYSKLIAGIQNGAPDGFALSVNGVATQFISYEGQFTSTSGAASGMTSTNIGVSQTGSETEGTAALGLTGTGGTAANFTWTKFTGIPYSPGQPNAGQTFILPTLPPQGIAIDNLAVTFVGHGDSDDDGMADLDEYIFGSDPHNAASRYAVTVDQTAPDTLQLSFHRIASNSYILESSPDLTAWSTLKTYPAGHDSDTVVGVTIISDTPAKFYRVRAIAP